MAAEVESKRVDAQVIDPKPVDPKPVDLKPVDPKAVDPKKKKSATAQLKSVWPMIWELVRPRRVLLAFSFLLLLVGRLCGLVLPAAPKYLLDDVIGKHRAGLLLPLVLLCGALGGAVWGGIVGVLKAVTGAHEVVTTIMLNFVAQWFLRFLIIGGPLPGATPSVSTMARL